MTFLLKTEPADDMDPPRNLPSERQQHVSKPQIFVHLEFGVSWSQRHTPRTHQVTYTSRNLREARERGSFPRQPPPPPPTNFRGAGHRSHKPARHGQEQPQQPQQPARGHTQASGPERPLEYYGVPEPDRSITEQRRASRSEARASLHGRGSSAPPPFHDSPWDAGVGPSSLPFQPAEQMMAAEPSVWKPLPQDPSRFRLGEDGLPWSSWAWPMDPYDAAGDEEEDERELQYANRPTTVPISPRRTRSSDPDNAGELESLSAAMMTVDNGFENQWWHQGPRESTNWWPGDLESPDRSSQADAALLPAAEPSMTQPSPKELHTPTTPDDDPSISSLVSPMSVLSTSPQRNRPLHRSLTTRSEELFY